MVQTSYRQQIERYFPHSWRGEEQPDFSFDNQQIAPYDLDNNQTIHLILEEKNRRFQEALQYGSERPSPLFIELMEEVNNYLDDFGGKFQFSWIALQSSKVVLLGDEDYEEIESKFSVSDGGTSGMNIPWIDPVLVKNSPHFFEYEKASTALHELLHRWFEMNAYGVTRDQHGKMDVTLTRSGLLTYEPRFSGYFLNEVPNYYWQQHFLDHLATNYPSENLREEFDQLEEFRDQKAMNIQEYFFQEYGLELRRENIWLSRDGSFDNGFSLMCECVDTLFDIFEPEEREALALLWLQAKIDPRHQRELKQKLEYCLGKGRYRDLKNLDYSSIVPFTVWLQKVRSQLMPDYR